MKLTSWSFLLVLVWSMLSACQTRGLPLHTSMQKIQKKNIIDKELDKESKTIDKGSTKNFSVLELKGKSLAKNESLFSHIPIINKLNFLPNINKIPVLRDVKKLFPKASKVSETRAIKKTRYLKIKSYSGGTVSDGLDMAVVRLGQSSSYARLIFDSYKWEGHDTLPTKKVEHSGTYIFTHEPSKNRITAIIDGYRGFSALAGDQSELYRDNHMVKTIRLNKYLDGSGFKFVIELKQDAKVYVYELHNPGRIIVDIMSI